ncbi:hypothetical protein [Klebsiella pneumoniae]|uniref:hypothetical protein n=1 Tax=Klebsiella pneumoniae TaxID=573 RepID=UPI00339BF852
MNSKPYIFAGTLTDSELIKWLEERVLALKSLEWNRRDVAELKNTCSALRTRITRLQLLLMKE